ncbi:cytochrome b [Rhodovulum imhoffii]|uniref:Cytochrome b n=1 Tax=Rhodovulum imhoffii TaxID=365340 RepID=A0A2T5BSG1_9RHOB|nr:cytochrome b/b6 domain-containing protein [Rhodovulum imhoffii]MBK5934757.1 cytochrome b [Rhodovulum imhoffii]PTN02181.1 cytochrome b [Rhodovulum imhoffii]
MIKVWDPFLRAFHWALVAAFAIVWLAADENQDLHEAAGYAVAFLISLRVIWGFIGPRYARFAQFLRGPETVRTYLGDMAAGRERRYLGHNPAGAAMILAMLMALAGTALTGWLMESSERQAMLPEMPALIAPVYADSGEHHAESTLEEVHETLANLLLLMAAVHVGGVIWASRKHHENLAVAMITGEKRAPGEGDIA